MQICKKLVVASMTTFMMLPIISEDTGTLAHASYLGDKYFTTRTTIPKRLTGTYRSQNYYKPGEFYKKHGVMITAKLKITQDGKKSYFKSWIGTKKNPYKHAFKQRFNAIYGSKYKGIYGLIPSGKHKRSKKYIGNIDSTWPKQPYLSVGMYNGKYISNYNVSKKTNLTF
ncbi:hypothetical protein ACS4N0_04455 [Levilactobacillus zymae]|uniref:hypothetical protein n=1 Tax=Levilactobacillus zymae TaxID=267363 RepID=UPI003FCC86C3